LNYSRSPSLLVDGDRSLLDVDLIHRFLSEDSYWARGRTRAQVEASIESSLCLGAYLPAESGGNRQVAFARAVTDAVSFAWICDVFVVPEERGHGYGKRMLEAILGHPSIDGLRTVLLGTADAHDLYRQFGFEAIDSTRYMRLGGAGPAA
jgi:GNAT superfamily N-acetyltransferase